MAMNNTPCLSFVVASRNDDHGGDLMRRTKIFANGLASLSRKYDLSAELIFVDWNPPEDRPPLFQAIDWDAKGPLVCRFIQVPGAIHKKFRNADTIPLFQMIAKNVGIRRARAPFVLATNTDLLFSEELIKFLAQATLDHDCMYRIDRLDVPADISEVSIEEQLEWCRKNVIRAHTDNGTIILNNKQWRSVLNKVARKLFSAPYVAHTNACGDFTLMSKDAWERVRGYLELPIYSLHLDGLLCIMAVGLGLREIILKKPMCIYHIEHGHGWANVSFEERLQTFIRKPWIDHGLFQEINDNIAKGRVPSIFNDEDWGLINEDLPEEMLS